MTDNQIENKTITISKVEDSQISTGSKKKAITDQDKKRYSFFLNTKEGKLTKPYQQFLNMELGVGSIVRIGFVTETFETNDGKTAKVNKIINFSEAFDAERANLERQLTASTPSITSESQPADSDVWEAKDRLHAAQTAANVVAMLGEGKEWDVNEAIPDMNVVYQWLMDRKDGNPIKMVSEIARTPQVESDEAVSDEDVPF